MWILVGTVSQICFSPVCTECVTSEERLIYLNKVLLDAKIKWVSLNSKFAKDTCSNSSNVKTLTLKHFAAYSAVYAVWPRLDPSC